MPITVDQVASDPELKAKLQANAAKAREASSAKYARDRAYKQTVAEQVASNGLPDIPQGQAPDHPIYKALYHSLVKAGLNDPEIAKIVLSNPLLIAQAQREDALKQREATNIPGYLQHHPPIVAIALEVLDSNLSTIAHRRASNMPLTETEQAIGRWIDVCEQGADRLSGESVRTLLESLIVELEREEQATAGDDPAATGDEGHQADGEGGGVQTVVCSKEAAEELEVERELTPPKASAPAVFPTRKKQKTKK